MTPQEALDNLSAFTSAASESVDKGERLDIDESFDVLQQLISAYETGVIDNIEWGEPGDCKDRIETDEDLRHTAHLMLDPVAMTETFEEHFARLASEQLRVKTLGLGRHQGNPHCIWCLQGM